VAPGSYEILATANSGQRLAGSVAVEASSTDVEDVTIPLSAGFRIKGRLIAEGQFGDAVLSNAAVLLTSSRPQFATATSRAVNGEFELAGVMPGEYWLQVSLPENVYVKRATLEGIDVLASLLSLKGQPQGILEVVISPNVARLEAVVLDEKQPPAPGKTVVLVPDTVVRFRSDLYHVAMTDASGRAHFEAVTPGTYKVFAWDRVENGAWRDPDFLSIYENRGMSVQLNESAAESISVRLSFTRN
jgi:hypothetical protein